MAPRVGPGRRWQGSVVGLSSPYVDVVVAGLEEAKRRILVKIQNFQATDRFGDGWDTGMEGATEVIDDLIRELHDVR